MFCLFSYLSVLAADFDIGTLLARSVVGAFHLCSFASQASDGCPTPLCSLPGLLDIFRGHSQGEHFGTETDERDEIVFSAVRSYLGLSGLSSGKNQNLSFGRGILFEVCPLDEKTKKRLFISQGHVSHVTKEGRDIIDDNFISA